MDLAELVASVKRMLEEQKEELEQCSRERQAREEEQKERRAEKQKDMGFIREAVIQVQTALETLRAERVGDHDEEKMTFKTPRPIPPPPLITPSASPQPPPWSSSNSSASPNKRQRKTSVPLSSRSTSVSDPNFDIQRERDASRTRLLDTWSQLAERYSRPLDEDDIVDIRTGEIIKDNGFWRSTRQYKFGEVLAPADTEETGAEETDDEDGVDELNAFPEEHDYLEDIFARGIQPLQPRAEILGTEDEGDLEDFLEAEQRRKEEFGSDFEEEEYETSPALTGGNTTLPASAIDDRPDDDDDDDDDSGQHSGLDDPASASQSWDELIQEESGSDDELDNWEPTEASIVVVTGDIQETPQEDQSESDSEVEIIESPPPLIHTTSPKQRAPPAQLNTPPNSHSSIKHPVLDYAAVPLPSSPSPPPLVETLPHKTRVSSVSPTKTRAPASEPRVLHMLPRARIPEVIDITDDEAEPHLGRSASQIPPLVRARNRALSLVPEVVITTLPPRAGQVKGTAPKTTPRHDLKSPMKPTRNPSTSKEISTPKKTSPSQPTPETSPTKKTIQEPKSILLAANHDTVLKPRKDTNDSLRKISLDQEEVEAVEDGPALRELSLEIGGSPVTPTIARKRLPRPSGSHPQIRMNRKRKRVSSEHENVTYPRVSEEPSLEPTQAKARIATKGKGSGTSPRKSSRLSRSRSKYVNSSDDGDLSSVNEDENYQYRRVAPRFTSVPQNPFPPRETPSHHPDMYPPVTDPRAQQIITSAMQQLSALLWTSPTHSGAITPMYTFSTPTHHRYSSVGPSFANSTPIHPHPYPFSFDPSFSNATLPPSSPDPPSSPTKSRERRKSLVSRSHSRGRRVSFCVDGEDGSLSDSGSESAVFAPRLTTTQHLQRQHDRSRSSRQIESKGKGKSKVVERNTSPLESGSEGDKFVPRGKKGSAGTKHNSDQKPGLESRQSEKEPSTSSSSRSRSRKKVPSKAQAKHL